MNKPWKVIVSHSDLNDRVGNHHTPKHLGMEEFKFSDKKEAIKKYCEQVKFYIDKSYDWKGHSMAAVKSYHEQDGKDVSTYVLFHHKGKEYDGLMETDLDGIE